MRLMFLSESFLRFAAPCLQKKHATEQFDSKSLHDLRDSHLEVLLCHVLPALAQGKHARLQLAVYQKLPV